ncbi:hypothetical protein E2C01_093455 [Portunus trituberculatus]|uniref:Uncharacterized protein n=1 Tax=Portunus trituberculatus TaxID=210409 RepID=A0A5B7JUH0_PORTR|nr:hypothetical protein [Portunus trituberculatus]
MEQHYAFLHLAAQKAPFRQAGNTTVHHTHTTPSASPSTSLLWHPPGVQREQKKTVSEAFICSAPISAWKCLVGG